MRLMFVGAGLMAFAFVGGCGRGAPPETSEGAPAIDAALDETAAMAPLSQVCQNLERVVAARADVPAFSSLPDGFALKEGVACARADKAVKVGAGQTPVTLSGYACVFKDAPDELEEAVRPVWQGVLVDAAECAANGWTSLAETDVSSGLPARRVLYYRDPDAPRLMMPEGQTEPVRFEWAQDSGQTIVLFVAAP